MATTEKPSRLLTLPAELRLQVYSFALSPTKRLYLHQTPTKRRAVSPTISAAILRTCKQIHAEAAGILYVENTIHIAVDARDTTWPALAEARLPQRILRKVENLCVLFDCTAPWWSRYDGVDFDAFTALTALKRFRFRVLVTPDLLEAADDEQDRDRDHQGDGASTQGPTFKFPELPMLATEILHRIPTSTAISYGPEPDDIETGSNELSEEKELSIHAPFNQFYTPVYAKVLTTGTTFESLVSAAGIQEVGAEDMIQSMKSVDLGDSRGCKAGSVNDVWADYRNGFLSQTPSRRY